MDKVIVTALLMIASITGAVIAINGMIPAISKSSSSMEAANDSVVRRIGTDVEILGVASDLSGTEIEAWIKNVGTYSIGPVSSVDVFLVTPGEGYSALRYDPAGLPGSWREYPLGASWERGEVLSLQIVIPQDFPVSAKYHILRVATPNGVVGEATFERW